MPEGLIRVGGIEVPQEYFLREPAALFVSGEDRLRLVSLNSLASVVLTIRGRFLAVAGGVPTAFAQTHTPTTDRTVASTDIPLGDGWLLGATIVATTASPIIGQAWVQLQLVRGGSGATVVLQTLAAGYVTDTQHLAWPGSPIASTLDGAGALRAITGSDPAAGAEMSETVPTGARWRLLGLAIELVTDATAANRDLILQVNNGVGLFWASDPNQSQAASVTRTHVAAQGSRRLNPTAGTAMWHYPHDMDLLGGFVLTTSTTSIQAGDNYGAPELLVREWLSGD